MARHRPGLIWSLLLLAGTIFLTENPASAATNYVWNNVNGGDWGTAANWTPNGVPGTATGDTATIAVAGVYPVTLNVTPAQPLARLTLGGAGGKQTLVINSFSRTLNLDGDSTVNVRGVISLSAGTLTGRGQLTVNGGMNWTGGTISGSGAFIIAETRPLNISGTELKRLDGRTITNAGVTTWSGSGDLAMFSSGSSPVAVFINRGDFVVENNQSVFWATGFTRPLFTNANDGTIIKRTGTGVTTFGSEVGFTNDGTVALETGTLRLNSSGFISDGAFQGPATLEFHEGTHELSASSQMFVSNVIFSGGTVNINGSYHLNSTTINGGTVNFNHNAVSNARSRSAAFSAGTLGGTGKLIVTDGFFWTGGTMKGSGETSVAILFLLGPDAKSLMQRRLVNTGTGSWSGTGNLHMGSEGGSPGARFINSGTFLVQNDQQVNWVFGNTPPVFNNSGIFTKSAGTGITTFGPNVAFNNSGTVNVNRGTLALNGGGNSTGIFQGTATLRFAGGTHEMRADSNITTTNVVFSFSTGLVNLQGTYNVPNTTISGGTAQFNGATAATAALTFSSGFLKGSGDLNVTGTMNWTGGMMSGGGSTTINSGGTLNISGGDIKALVQRTVNNEGATNWSGIGNLLAGSDAGSNGARFLNAGTFVVQNDQQVIWAYGNNPPVFTNTGTGIFTKSAGTGVTTFGSNVAFNNNGTVNANSGTLRLSGGGSSGAAFEGTATLEFNGGMHELRATSSTTTSNVIFSGGTVNAAGNYRVANTTINGGTANFDRPSSLTTALTLSSGTLGGSGTVAVTGTMNWTGGTMSGSGITTIRSVATLNISGFTDKNLIQRILHNIGTATWSGLGPLHMGSNGSSAGAIFSNSGTFLVQNDSFVNWVFGSNPPVFNNYGTFTKSGGSGFTAFFSNVPFNNSGLVNVNSGTLSLLGGGTSSGTFQGAATLRFSGGIHDLVIGSRITTTNVAFGHILGGGGTANVAGIYNVANTIIDGGTANFNHNASSTNVMLSSGTLGGSATFTVNDLMEWSGGTVSGSGTLNIPATRRLNISGSTAKNLIQRTLDNRGTTNWSGTGNLHMGSSGSSTSAVINNIGTFVAQNDQQISWVFGNTRPVFNNSGTFTKNTGAGVTTFGSNVPFNNSGTVNARSGTLRLDGGYTQTAGTTRLNGGDLASNTTLMIQGGQLIGNGTITGNVSSAGVVSPGLSPGTLFITGNYVQTATGTLAIEVGGTTPGSQFDRLRVSGTATLGGTLDIRLINGFAPVAGTTFRIMTFASRPGSTQFATVTGATASFNVNYAATFINLVATGAVADPPSLLQG